MIGTSISGSPNTLLDVAATPEMLRNQIFALIAERDELKAKLAETEKQLIFGFYEDEYPKYAQGPQQSEIQDLATAEEVNNLVLRIRELRASLAERDAQLAQARETAAQLAEQWTVTVVSKNGKLTDDEAQEIANLVGPCIAEAIRGETLSAPAPAWRDIASAPKDGTRVLVDWGRDGVVVARWHSWQTGPFGPGACWMPEGNVPINRTPTHWQPLPAPPAPQTPEEK